MSYEDYFKSLAYGQLKMELKNLEDAIARFGAKKNEIMIRDLMREELEKRKETKLKPGGSNGSAI